MSRYGNVGFVESLDLETGLLLIKKAYEEKQREQAFELYKMLYPLMDKENFISFEEFYIQGLQNSEQNKKTPEEIIAETRELYYKNWQSE